ncbi:RES family NAD+ phosphorylase [Pseudomonas sp. Teo4]|uniref:RES family NAD+ phosphorylase n=1 Tax=Pseudomonas sp. Teo4 TaxID=3064528 RepID=UPI002AB9F23F|nr:RES family NAD+ phosphorylase [Pseudomonas sp. Teo4]MDZ3995540.1 hypothetical protein [Pseudomonas sp. Teo4]
MSRTVKQYENELTAPIAEAISKYPDLIRQILEGTVLHRVQPSRYDANPVNYRADSDTRYADPDKLIGVYYLGFTQEVAVAESFQPGQGVDDQPVRFSRLEGTSLHQLKAARILNVIDVAALANRATHHKVRDIVQAKGQGREGYALTQKISQACIYRNDVDGLLYQSTVYSVTGSLKGCNLVLFAGRSTQIEAVDYQPVMEVVLSNGETAIEFLDSLGVALE